MTQARFLGLERKAHVIPFGLGYGQKSQYLVNHAIREALETMNTREHFKKQGLGLDWGKQKVVIEVGREKDKIVCSPKAFRYLKRAIEALNDIGYVDPILEGEMIDAQLRETKPRKGRRDGLVRSTQVEPDEYLQGILSRIRSESDALGVLDHGETRACTFSPDDGYDENGYLILPATED